MNTGEIQGEPQIVDRNNDESTAAGVSIVAHWVLVDRRRVALRPGDNIIGRDADVAVRLQGQTVSRRHACIVVGAEGARLKDLGSKNGTTLGGRVITEAPLNDGDYVEIGVFKLLYRTSAASGSTETQGANQ